MFKSLSLTAKTAKEIEKEAKSIVLKDNADDETFLNYKAICQSIYQDAVEAYDNQESLGAFYNFTLYLHLTAQLPKKFQIEGNQVITLNALYNSVKIASVKACFLS